MLIIKKYRDYYDTSIGFGGVDTTCVYNRTPFVETDKGKVSSIHKQFLGPKYRWHDNPFYYDRSSYRQSRYNKLVISIKPFVIGFCGKTYPGYVFELDRSIPPNEMNTHSEVVFNADDFFKLYPLDKKNDDYKRIVDFFAIYDGKENHTNLFVEYNTPIFLYDYGTKMSTELDETTKELKRSLYFITNPRLMPFQFYKLFDSFTTFQEIQMYLQGVLGSKENEVIVVDDKYRIAAHGFDKWSFRNPDPPKRKQKGKN